MAHSRTRDLPDKVRRADIVVAAVGRAEMVKGDWIKPGAIVIDVGINRLPPAEGETKGRLVGDVDYDSVAAVADAITPVPGGVGPMTIACLLRNTLVAAHRRAGLADPERSEEHTSEIPSLMRSSYAVFFLKKKTHNHE